MTQVSKVWELGNRTCLFLALGLLLNTMVYAAENIPVYPCDFYGQEEKAGALPAGSVVSVKTAAGIILGSVMEPPEEVKPITIVPAALDSGLSYMLRTPQTEVSLFIPGWLSDETRAYLDSVLRKLETSADFAALIDDEYFSCALDDTVVRGASGWDNVFVADYRLVAVSGSPLSPGWQSRFASVQYKGDVRITRFNCYACSNDGRLLPVTEAPAVEIVDKIEYRADDETVKSLAFYVDTDKPVEVTLVFSHSSSSVQAQLRRGDDGVWQLLLSGSDCRAQVQIKYADDEEAVTLITLGGGQ